MHGREAEVGGERQVAEADDRHRAGHVHLVRRQSVHEAGGGMVGGGEHRGDRFWALDQARLDELLRGLDTGRAGAVTRDHALGPELDVVATQHLAQRVTSNLRAVQRRGRADVGELTVPERHEMVDEEPEALAGRVRHVGPDGCVRREAQQHGARVLRPAELPDDLGLSRRRRPRSTRHR